MKSKSLFPPHALSTYIYIHGSYHRLVTNTPDSLMFWEYSSQFHSFTDLILQQFSINSYMYSHLVKQGYHPIAHLNTHIDVPSWINLWDTHNRYGYLGPKFANVVDSIVFLLHHVPQTGWQSAVHSLLHTLQRHHRGPGFETGSPQWMHSRSPRRAIALPIRRCLGSFGSAER